MDRFQLCPLLYLVLVVGLAAGSSNSSKNINVGNGNSTAGSNSSSVSPSGEMSVTSIPSTSPGSVAKEETSGSKSSSSSSSSASSTSSTVSSALCFLVEKDAKVLVLALGVAVILCVVLLITTVVLACQLCQRKAWRPSPRPLRSNADLIRSPEGPAGENLAETGMLLAEVKLDKVDKDGDTKEEPERSPTHTSSVQEPESAPLPADPAPDPIPSVSPAADMSTDTAEGALTA